MGGCSSKEQSQAVAAPPSTPAAPPSGGGAPVANTRKSFTRRAGHGSVSAPVILTFFVSSLFLLPDYKNALMVKH